MKTIAELEGALDRRMLLRLGAAAGIGAALMPRLAWAARTPDLLPNVRKVIEKWVGPGRFPGMVASLGLPGRGTQYVARGSEGFTDPDPVTPDSLFRIYSLTKPITGMAAMMLIEDGKLGLDQPLYDILPKFREMQVQKVADGSVTDLVPAKQPIRIRNLVTHTAGLGYTIEQTGPIKQLMEAKGLVPGLISHIEIPGLWGGKPAPSLAKFADRLAEVPLVYQPGTKWSYSVGLDLMGRVIEVVSGKSFDIFLKERVFDPAGMNSTFFQVPASQARRLTTNYGVVANRLIPIDKGAESIFLDKPPFPFGGAGLVSTPRDYDRFLRMLANFGTLDGQRVISERAVSSGTGNLLPEGVAGPATMMPASQFGAGGRVGIGPEAGIYGWSGAAGTVGMVDMRNALTSSIFVQFMPPNSLELLPDFQKAIRADVMALLENKS